MSILLIGYILLSLGILLILNLFLNRRRQKRNSSDVEVHEPDQTKQEPLLEEPAFVEPTAISSVAGPVNAPIETPHSEAETQTKPPAEGFGNIRIVIVMMLGVFVAILNQTVDNVAIPHMMLDFNVSASTMQWLVTAYMLVNGVLIPITAFLMETFGTRKLFITAMSFFTVGSFLCGLSPTFAFLITGRVIQAVGAGILLPMLTNVFLSIYPPEKRGKAMGTMGIAIIFAPAIGPTLGGWVVETYTWRLLFYAMVPIGAFDLFLALLWMKDLLHLSFPKFDIRGVILSTVGFGGLLYGVSEAGNKGWGSTDVVATIVIGLLSLLIFVQRELTAEKPLLEFRVFKYDMFTLTMVISAVVNMAMYAGMILLPIYLQNIRNFTPLQSGVLLLPGAIIMGIMGPIAGAIFDKIGARLLSVVGLIIVAVTTFEFSKLTMESMYSHIITLYIFRSFGMSLLLMPLMTAGLNQLPSRLNSHGTAMRNTIRQVAGALGTAILVTIMSNRTTLHFGEFSNAASLNNPGFMAQFSSLTMNMAVPAQTGQVLATETLYGMAAKQAAIDGINDAFIVATGIAVVALIMSLFIRKVYPAEE